MGKVLIFSLKHFISVKEVTTTKYRHAACVLSTLGIAACFMLLPLLNYLLPNWRHFMAVYTGIQAVISLVLFGFVLISIFINIFIWGRNIFIVIGQW